MTTGNTYKTEQGARDYSVARLRDAAENFAALLRQENTALRAADRKKFLSLQAEKNRLADEYEISLKAMTANIQASAPLSAEHKQNISELHAVLQILGEENALWLKRAQEVTHITQKRLLEAGRKALHAAQMAETGYAADGKTRAGQGPSRPVTVNDAI